VDNTYSQNQRGLEEYYAAIDAGRLAVFRGLELNRDDLIRRDVITRLICHFELPIAAVESAWNIVFADYFADSLKRLEPMIADGLVEIVDGSIRILPRGRLLVRNICMTFDAYMAKKTGPVGFSKVI
jgi:oxygen-independent coproporphyrinogen-3 oxidase